DDDGGDGQQHRRDSAERFFHIGADYIGFMKSSWLILSVALLAPQVPTEEHQHAAVPLEKLGSVTFANSCAAAAQMPFNRAVALLHSFEFRLAIEGFESALKADPSCGIASWGIALSHWSNPFAPGIRPAAQLQRGLAAIDRAKAAGSK